MPVIESARATHTTLEVANLDNSLRFYRDVLGLRTHQVLDKAGHLLAANGHYAAFIELPRRSPQPFLNFYARPVPDGAAVDLVYGKIRAVRQEYGIQEITPPGREDAAKFGVGTYGFYLRDADANWWRIEENQGPFGPMEMPAGAEPRHSIVPAGPISYVMLECRKLDDTMRFYREFLGVDAERRGPHYFVSGGNGGVNVIVVEVGDKLLEQTVMNHHGITLWTEQAVIDTLHAAAEEQKERFGIRKVMKATHQHGSYSFYMEDLDSNWWEIEVWEDLMNPWDRAVRERELRAAGQKTVYRY
jgi:catechol 2,3-dioxygenase-like lactoylglutathione lyase family enzyme